jgi:hypothetical protein
MGSARADQQDPLRQLEWMEPKDRVRGIFRGAIKQKAIFKTSALQAYTFQL